MNDDELMDKLLRETMAASAGQGAPQLSPAFNAKVMAQVRPRRLTPFGRVLMGVYAIVALAVAVWTMQELGVALIAASTLGGVVAAFGLSRYVRAVTIESV